MKYGIATVSLGCQLLVVVNALLRVYQNTISLRQQRKFAGRLFRAAVYIRMTQPRKLSVSRFDF